MDNQKVKNSDLLAILDGRLTTVRNNFANAQKGIGSSGKALTPKAKPSVTAGIKKELNALVVIRDILTKAPDGLKLSNAAADAFNALCNPSSKASAITLVEGTNILEAIAAYETEYPNAKEVGGRFMAAVSEQGFKLDGLTIVKK